MGKCDDLYVKGDVLQKTLELLHEDQQRQDTERHELSERVDGIVPDDGISIEEINYIFNNS